eukprot:gene18557-22155_t
MSCPEGRGTEALEVECHALRRGSSVVPQQGPNFDGHEYLTQAADIGALRAPGRHLAMNAAAAAAVGLALGIPLSTAGKALEGYSPVSGRMQIRLITNVGPVHTEGVGGIDGVARAKGELFDSAREGDICVINGDDQRVRGLQIPEAARVISFGTAVGCHVRMQNVHAAGPAGLYTRFQLSGREDGSGTEKVDVLGLSELLLAAGAIGSQPAPPDWALGYVRVPDTLVALQAQDLARLIRRRYGQSGAVVGITGSAGKTTTRAMTQLVLQGGLLSGAVHATQGNMNNHIGVPVTLLQLPSDSAACVLEMGMNHFGEIALLADIARPN